MTDITVLSTDAIQKVNADYEMLLHELRNIEQRMRARILAATDDLRTSVATSLVKIPKRVGTTPGSATVQPKKLNSGGVLVDDGVTVTVYSWVSTDSQTPTGGGHFYLHMSQDQYGTWWFDAEDCP